MPTGPQSPYKADTNFSRLGEDEDPSLPGGGDLDPYDSDGGKLAKDDPEVNYRYCSDPAMNCCLTCRHFESPGKCEIVAGTIRAVDTCNLYEESEQAALDEPVGRSTELPVEPRVTEAERTFQRAYDEEPDDAIDDADDEHDFMDSLFTAGWKQTEAGLFTHPSLAGHHIRVRGGRWEHRSKKEGRIASGPVSNLKHYGEVIAPLLQEVRKAMSPAAMTFRETYGRD
jgi:hypothetical protein